MMQSFAGAFSARLARGYTLCRSLLQQCWPTLLYMCMLAFEHAHMSKNSSLNGEKDTL